MKVAVIVWLPADNAEVENEAAPALTCELPRILAPSAKLTLPLGAGAVVATPGVIVAANVTDPP